MGAPRPSRKNKPGQHTYLLTGIPTDLWTAVQAKAQQQHQDECGKTNSHTQCPEHSVRVLLLGQLRKYLDTPYR